MKQLTILLLLLIVNIKGHAEQLRIIALAPHIIENLYEIGAGELIVGTTDHADFPEEAKKIRRIGNYAKLNIEAVLSLDPDVVIAWKSGNPSDDIEKLKKLGINIVYSQPNELEDVAKELRQFGRLTNRVEQAELAAKAFEKQLSLLRAKYLNKTQIITFYELWSRPLTTVAGNAWPQHQLNVCGAKNPFIDSATDYPQINVEQVVLAGPEVIIQPSSHGVNSPDLISWQQWESIPAVTNNAFVKPNADKMHRMTSRSLDELATLCQKIDTFR